MAKRFSAEQWRAWFGDFDQSGLSVQQFCDSKGTTANTFYKWRRKLTADQTESALVPLVMPANQIEFELPCGAIARVANDAPSLQPILSVLLQASKR